MANIRDVANHAGVSVSSVSNVLNGRTNQMRPETLARIRQSMRDLNYLPNRVAQQLKTGQARMIGLLVPSIVNPSFAMLTREVDRVAKANQYRVLLGNTYRQEDEEKAFLEDMFAHGVKGVIVVATAMDRPHFANAARHGMVMVNYDSLMSVHAPDGNPPFDSVSMDNVEAGRLAAEHLIERGCRQLVFVTEATQLPSRLHKIEGFYSAVNRHGLQESAQVIEGKAGEAYGDAEMTELGRSLAAKVLEQSPRPDGIVAINDAMGIGLMAGLRSAGIRIPQDMSVIGIDNIPLADLVQPPMSSVMPPLADMVTMMVDRLLTRIENPDLTPEEFLFVPKLISRQSVIEKGEP
ncbi:ribose operon repressor [Trabulsiella guamensis ATCC 49490]|uniref:Ribose operon repressor n=1 Tax=Trabulsiella guamensis ATCC 49490 TaxID=1005994 RepID=A0A084ZKP7_9ENTR|nr:LacI family DNA-binding transcriptional regulator [Trabulsiella guamensis]KFB98041.1 ribose operon repressor [Trabulsiella guamensis ATCC 49490]